MRRVRRRRWCGGVPRSRERPGIRRERLGALVDGGVAMELPPVASSRGAVGSVVGGAARRAPVAQRPAPASVRLPRPSAQGTLCGRGSAAARSGHAPAALLGGSPLDMATPPSPFDPLFRGGHHAGIARLEILPGGRADAGPATAARPGRRGRVPCVPWTWPTHPKPRNSGPRSPQWLRGQPARGLGRTGVLHDARERKAFNEEWTAKLYAGGWICASWPAEYGGKGLSLLQQVVLNEEFARAGAPLRADFFGDTLVGPDACCSGAPRSRSSSSSPAS